jgi:hypothetical protein
MFKAFGQGFGQGIGIGVGLMAVSVFVGWASVRTLRTLAVDAAEKFTREATK